MTSPFAVTLESLERRKISIRIYPHSTNFRTLKKFLNEKIDIC